MKNEDEFFEGIKGTTDPQEWADSAAFFVRLREPTNVPEPAPDLEQEKTAGFREAAHALGGMAQRVDPTGISKGISEGGRPALVAALAGGALLGGATALTNRGKKELGGKSAIEDRLSRAAETNAQKPEDDAGFFEKAQRHGTDFSARLARLARQHPVKAGLVAAIPGAQLGLKGLKAIYGKGR